MSVQSRSHRCQGAAALRLPIPDCRRSSRSRVPLPPAPAWRAGRRARPVCQNHARPRSGYDRTGVSAQSVRPCARWGPAAPLVTSASLTPCALQGVDGLMRAREDVHLLFAIGGKAVGEPYRKIHWQGVVAGGGKRGKSVPDDLMPRFLRVSAATLLPPPPRTCARIHDRRGDLLRRQRRKLAGKLCGDAVPGDTRDGHRPTGWCRPCRSASRGAVASLSHGHFTSGGIDDRMESTLPPVFSPKMVPRS